MPIPDSPPLRYCDIVMKGGLTSGVVYPLAITELAEEFRFKSIGGTSAGAIAATITAAAEYQRETKSSAAGFARLADLPKFLTGKGNLLGLFPPTKNARGFFQFAMSFVSKRPWLAPLRIFGVSWPLTGLFVALAVALWYFGRLSILGVILMYFAFVAVVLFWSICYTIPRNRFGFSTGMAPAGAAKQGVTEWLHNELQLASGRTLEDPPLTFGDLTKAGIELKMITTALTHGRPYTLPFREQTFSFRVSEWKDYFPKEVLDHLVARGLKIDTPQFDDLYILPFASDFPVVVATRMSLSFPILFTLVPLYAIDYASPHKDTYKRSWFIDGGLSSNFPLNLFDSILPRWPTFGINLASPHADHEPADPNDPTKWVHMAETHSEGRAKRFMNIRNRGRKAISGYVAAALDAIRNWRDNTQMSAPGFFDRVVHINLTKGEGGLNLDMPQEVIDRLTKRGTVAGQMLCERYGARGATAPGLNWNTHRWARYKIAMTVLQKAIHGLDTAFRWQDPAYPHYHTLVKRDTDDNPRTWYWWRRNRRAYVDLTYDFLRFATEVRNAPVHFDDDRPKGKPELRITAKT